MRKLVFAALAGVFMLSSGFSVGRSSESLVGFESFKLEDFGTCNIEIVNRRTGEVVYSISLPANTPEVCTEMGKRTLAAFIKGNL
ncbi:hypothetical protein [uncultured Nonlabens sp.]|uniref:hypothetical protein n=1 Tax=uncultured Nonlabens sp. TaxID=859306 RepID=UPI0026119664|nr:hypothetical protein [uncultured Nonlabens sp.]